MGAKDSKPSFISYEDAVKRVSDSESRRICEAFKRCAGPNGTALSLEAFAHEVLFDSVPYEVADWMYQACGGTKRGISFRDLLCGIVVLTKGNIEEKIKFLWTLYVNNQSDNGTYIYKWDFARALHMENTSLSYMEAPKTTEILTGLFGSNDRVVYEQFRSWLLIHKDATALSRWLLSDRGVIAQDLETPTFYQSLAGVTHLEERDIIELEKCFWSLRNAAPTGQLDAESLTPLLSPPLPRAAVAGAFLAFDENRDGHVDFKELCCGLSAACRGPTTERLKFCFKIFDVDRDGLLTKKELIDMVGILCTVANESLKNQSSRASTPSDGNDSEGTDKGFDPEVILLNLSEKLVTTTKGRKPMFQLGPTGETEDVVMEEETENEGLIGSDMALTLEDFLIWSVESAESLVTPFLDLIFEVCHIVLGLRPQCKHQERDIVLGWLRREVQRGYSVGQFWYLVAADWWAAWLAYTSAGSTDTCCRQPVRQVDEAIVCDESFTTNSTESMGSLLWRADSVSVGSAGSSSGVSSAPPRALEHPPPGPVHNERLIAPHSLKVRTLTGEGGHLRRDVTLAQHRDFELLPDALWRAIAAWYGNPDPLPRQVIRPPNSDVELELYPLQLKILRHVAGTQRLSCVTGVGGVSVYSSVPLAPAPPDTHLAYTAAFSRLATVKQVTEFLCSALGLAREDVRMWVLTGGENKVLLDDERPTLHELHIDERSRLLLELRNCDLTWPEEISALSMRSSGANANRSRERRDTLTAPDVPGATGLHNLGNTCFMNAALQAVWNTGPLTRYFNSGMHLYEVNTTNPLGTKGALALRFGELCKEVWSCSARSVAPLRVRWCVSRWARALSGGGQHDAQELLAWLLDALHEDLNRGMTNSHHPHRDSDNRPDQVVAAEAWEQHTARNNSIMTDLFYGQLKSKVRCDTCGHESVRFDAFNMLSLPLPMESYVRCEVRVMLLDGSVPVKYGVRVNSEGTYLDLKKKLSELCRLPPETMLLVELSGAMIGRTMEDEAKINPAISCNLYAYEIPHCDIQPEQCDVEQQHNNGWLEESGQWAEVSVPRASNTSSLCMPALFCFKRSRSEILMYQTPPNTFYGPKADVTFTDTPGDYRSNTLPKDLSELKKMDKNGNQSPTLSVKSLNLKPPSPRLGKVKFASSPSNMNRMDQTNLKSVGKLQYLVAVHRKQVRSDAYFLPSARSRPALFGVPLLVNVRSTMCGRDVYADVWTQVARLLSARPNPGDAHNHATDCDDSLGYEFPFTLRVVNCTGARCGACPWPSKCRGCVLPCTPHPYTAHVEPSPLDHRKSVSSRTSDDSGALDTNSPIAQAKLSRHSSRVIDNKGSQDEPETESELDLSVLWQRHRYGRTNIMLAIDWDPTALHLRYQSTREKTFIEHPSVAACAAAGARPIDLGVCLRAFTSEERLETRYHCSTCRTHQPATKKLQIWRAPPILIIHLKRFQYVNSKWIKSQKVVNFPFQDFDPTDFLASVPQETILRHTELKNMRRRSSMFVDVDDHISESDDSDVERNEASVDISKSKPKTERRRRDSTEVRGRKRLESTSLVTTPVTDDNLVDYHQHHLKVEQDPFDLKYRLYAVVSHSGQLSGGHYVAYARNPTGAWLCYNDSSCRELTFVKREGHEHPVPPIDPASAYLLFYERQGLDYDRYLPDVTGKEPSIRDTDALDPEESDLKKMCVLT